MSQGRARLEPHMLALLDSSPQAVVCCGPDRRILWWSTRAEGLLGWSAEAAGQEVCAVLLGAEDCLGLDGAMVRGGSPISLGRRQILRKDGSRFPADVHVAPAGEGFALFLGDATDQVRAEAELRKARDYLNSLLNAVADPIFVKDRDHRWILLNDAYCRFMGNRRDELLGKSDFDFFPAHEAQVFWQHDEIVFETGREDENEEEFTDVHGVTHHIVTKKTLCVDPEGDRYLVGIIRDVTRQKALEHQVFQMQKMEALGQMAGGIAHDFNNLLGVITGYSQLVLAELPEESPLRRDLEEVLGAARSAGGLTRQILTFSRHSSREPRSLDLNEVVSGSQALLRSILGEEIRLVLELEPGLPSILADPRQMAQVLMNLALNARDAMPEGGTLRVTTQLSQRRGEGAPERPDVCLTVADTGHGMEPHVKNRVFEPFFTTKKRGKGTGMGLSTVYGIITGSEGTIAVDSRPGGGASFRLYLPVHLPGPDVGAPLRARDRQPSLRDATVLVVEDERALRVLVARVLSSRGYVVLTAETAAEALAAAQSHDGPLHLLLTDMLLPDFNGRDLAERVLSIRKETRVLLMSGFTDDLLPREATLEPFPLLSKPFSPRELAARVEEVLEA